jgi:DNA-binding winged helix-turn-helix (wHTH) protein
VNERPALLKPVGPASLAGEEDFQLGSIWVRPSLREVEAGGVRETLEPRVMQVLVALARANGAVVSRDALIQQCWGGRIVGEDAINRCVSKVRQLSELGGSKAFDVETIPRVGYRLRESADATGISKGTSTKDSLRRVWPFWSAAAALVLLTAAYLGRQFFGHPPVPVLWQVGSYELVANTAMEERMPRFHPMGISSPTGPRTISPLPRGFI